MPSKKNSSNQSACSLTPVPEATAVPSIADWTRQIGLAMKLNDERVKRMTFSQKLAKFRRNGLLANAGVPLSFEPRMPSSESDARDDADS